MSDKPIGVFDSGVGGISVLREIVKLMPNENYIFYADSGNAPYGTKELEQVRELTLNVADHLVEEGVKALVVACNTATSAAIDILREKYKDIPVIGIEPALKPAVEHAVKNSAAGRKAVLVLATPMTLREEKFEKLMKRFEDKARIIPLSMPGLVEFVEKGDLESTELEDFLKVRFSGLDLSEIDSVVLGCTHYPFVKKAIGNIVGKDALLIDGGEGTAKQTKRLLKEAGLLTESVEKGRVTVETSAGRETIDLAYKLLGENL